MANTDMGKLEVKAQLTQQHKPTWLVECNCPTHRSWQSDKAVTLVPRRTWLKTNEGQGDDPQRNPKKNYIGQNREKKRRSTWWRNKELSANVPIEVKCQIEPMEWRQSHAVPVKSNMTKKKAPPDQAPIEPNKGSALPSKGKQEEDQAPNQIKAPKG